MVKIRLARGGAKKRPFYRIVVADSRHPRDGRFIERIGFFNPMGSSIYQKCNFFLNMEKLSYWKQCGAQISPRVIFLIKQFNIQK